MIQGGIKENQFGLGSRYGMSEQIRPKVRDVVIAPETPMGIEEPTFMLENNDRLSVEDDTVEIGNDTLGSGGNGFGVALM
ncbi:hypothetical protein L1987_45789 [Smallanthus sonchifolius]|uniref:Uncharacterized protein n=1 Tax=Smallanthus sonchifolius TaxID=185202 RepID=A0ACB9FY11_9ASTR|nr:hypothetical protein L1987_45789 [Smallanthus sonchifolius]